VKESQWHRPEVCGKAAWLSQGLLKVGEKSGGRSRTRVGMRRCGVVTAIAASHRVGEGHQEEVGGDSEDKCVPSSAGGGVKVTAVRRAPEVSVVCSP